MASEAKRSIKNLIEEDKLADAERQASDNLKKFRDQSNNEGIATMLLATAEVKLAQVQPSQALKVAREAWPLAKNMDNKKLIAEILLAMVNGLNMQGSRKEALKAATTSLPQVVEAKEPALEADLHHAMAVAHLKLDDADDAMEAAQKAMTIFKNLKDKTGEAKSLTVIAKAERVQGRLEQAISTAKDAATMWRSLGNGAGIVGAVEVVIDAQAAQGYPKAALAIAEEELGLLQKAGASTKNQIIMMEMVVKVASEQGQKLEALRAMEDMIQVFKKAGDKVGEARKTMQAAEMHVEMNHSQDGLRLAKEAESLFQGLGLSDDVEEAKKLQTTIFVRKGQHSKAPHRSEALLQLKAFVRAVEQREEDTVKQYEVDLQKSNGAIKDSEMTNALESLFERDPTALGFLESHGWDLTSFKVPTKIFQYPHKAFYLTTIAGGMNFGPQFRSVNPYRKGMPNADPRACSVCVLPETEAWQGSLMYRHGIMDAGIQACGSFGYPPQ